MNTVEHYGRETAYHFVDRTGGDADEEGDETGPTLCFVHGAGSDRRQWTPQHRLADRFPLATVDLSGHGDSEDVEAEPGFTTLSAYVDDALAVYDAVAADVLVGCSLGGAVVMQALLERDVDPDGVVLAATGARLGVLDDLLAWLEDDFDRAVEFLHGSDRLFHDPDPDLLERSREVLYETGRAVTARDFQTSHRFDVRDRLGEIDTPTLVCYGKHDRMTPPWFHEYLATEIPETTLVEFADAAHLLMLERPDAFNGVVAEFCSSLQVASG
ncbi:alpha/beta fold hydrolase [Natrialbaceae archaeon GCM10025810]|uniref:alpha/beta fold hydrolase n=1 Tax=Halovalidus salilacus TaxID=3075124 RepID=UPI0036172278